MEKITNFLKTYWWTWLILLVASSLFLIFGTSAIESLIDNLLSLIFTIALIMVIGRYTFGRGQTQSWGVFRILGILGVLFFSFSLYFVLFEEGKKNLEQAIDDSLFNSLWLGLIFSLFLFVLGEIILYLDNLQNSFKNFEAINSGGMTCPRCYGKGFVDLDDIKRLGMKLEWGQGFCRYCEGEGEVEKGKTKTLNPLITDNGPATMQDVKSQTIKRVAKLTRKGTPVTEEYIEARVEALRYSLESLDWSSDEAKQSVVSRYREQLNQARVPSSSKVSSD
jgi:hypothetical protein